MDKNKSRRGGSEKNNKQLGGPTVDPGSLSTPGGFIGVCSPSKCDEHPLDGDTTLFRNHEFIHPGIALLWMGKIPLTPVGRPFIAVFNRVTSIRV